MKVTLIIPVKNGAATLGACLQAIRNQTLDNIEIIVLDSMSADKSREIALQFGATIIDIPAGSFNHGLTRNLGIQQATTELVYLTVQDAVLAKDDMLERMAKHFDDAATMGVAGHQAIEWGQQDKNPAYWFKPYTPPEIGIRHYPDNEFKQLSLKQQFELSSWDDVNAMYRRSALQRIPFKETDFSEDWMWANEALGAGMKLLYDPSILVYHYHHQHFRYRFTTLFTVNYHFYKAFKQLPPIPWSPVKYMKASFTILKRKEVALTKKPYWLLHNLGINAADFLSTLVFRVAHFAGGDKLLQKTHQVFCSEVPVGSLKTGKSFCQTT